MHDARDAEDTRLLESGDHKQLLENYVYVVRERCFVRLRDRDAADEVAQRVFLRLWKELAAGKRYRVPFRVVVWKVTDWLCGAYDWQTKQGADLPDEWDTAAPDPFEGWEDDHDFAALLLQLSPGQREVAELVYLHGLAPAEVAERLGMNANAVYQRLHNANKNLAGMLSAA
jgi:RNA polymerase sigma-70 factor (ECF subfamily)